MSKTQHLPVRLSVVDKLLDSLDKSPQETAEAARDLIAELKEQRKALTEGHIRPTLTVCNGRIGYVEPKDLEKLIKGQIPRITVYRVKKGNHHMPMFYKNAPGFYIAHPPSKGKKVWPKHRKK